jgi:8-oxo-dGTP diphosphatase
LLVRRGHPPDVGRYSVPGGRVEPGEALEKACAREVLEECGLRVVVERPLGEVDRPAPGGGTFHITDFACSVEAGEVRAGDDAAEAAWVPLAHLARYPLVPGLLHALQEWGVVA